MVMIWEQFHHLGIGLSNFFTDFPWVESKLLISYLNMGWLRRLFQLFYLEMFYHLNVRKPFIIRYQTVI